MDKVNNLYTGQTVYFGTIHKKEEAIRPLLLEYQMNCISVDIDTDALGTFSGEIKREGTVPETLRKKIKAVIERIPHANLILASEGSFGPHPLLPFINCNQETLMFYNKKTNLEIVLSDITLDTNIAEREIIRDESYENFLKDVLFPSHGVILQSNDILIKGIINRESLDTSVQNIFKDIYRYEGKF